MLCGLLGGYYTTPWAMGLFLPANPGDGFKPSEQAACMYLMETTLTRMNQKGCFPKAVVAGAPVEVKWGGFPSLPYMHVSLVATLSSVF